MKSFEAVRTEERLESEQKYRNKLQSDLALAYYKHLGHQDDDGNNAFKVFSDNGAMDLFNVVYESKLKENKGDYKKISIDRYEITPEKTDT
jgi:hypothetical protein